MNNAIFTTLREGHPSAVFMHKVGGRQKEVERFALYLLNCHRATEGVLCEYKDNNGDTIIRIIKRGAQWEN